MINSMLSQKILLNIPGTAGKIDSSERYREMTLKNLSSEFKAIPLKNKLSNAEGKPVSDVRRRALVVSVLVEKQTINGYTFLIALPIVSRSFNYANGSSEQCVCQQPDEDLTEKVSQFGFADILLQGQSEKDVIDNVLSNASIHAEFLSRRNERYDYYIAINYQHSSTLSISGFYVVSPADIVNYLYLFSDILNHQNLQFELSSGSYFLRQLARLNSNVGDINPVGYKISNQDLIGFVDSSSDIDFLINTPVEVDECLDHLPIVGRFIHYSANYSHYYKNGLDQFINYFAKQSLKSSNSIADSWLSNL